MFLVRPVHGCIVLFLFHPVKLIRCGRCANFWHQSSAPTDEGPLVRICHAWWSISAGLHLPKTAGIRSAMTDQSRAKWRSGSAPGLGATAKGRACVRPAWPLGLRPILGSAINLTECDIEQSRQTGLHRCSLVYWQRHFRLRAGRRSARSACRSCKPEKSRAMRGALISPGISRLAVCPSMSFMDMSKVFDN